MVQPRTAREFEAGKEMHWHECCLLLLLPLVNPVSLSLKFFFFFTLCLKIAAHMGRRYVRSVGRELLTWVSFSWKGHVLPCDFCSLWSSPSLWFKSTPFDSFYLGILKRLLMEVDQLIQYQDCGLWRGRFVGVRWKRMDRRLWWVSVIC